MYEKSTTTDESNVNDPFPRKRGVIDFANGTDPADPNEEKTCEVANCGRETVNGALCEQHVPPRIQPGRICHSCGSVTTKTYAIGTPDGGVHPVCSATCLRRLSERWTA